MVENGECFTLQTVVQVQPDLWTPVICNEEFSLLYHCILNAFLCNNIKSVLQVTLIAREAIDQFCMHSYGDKLHAYYHMAITIR